jgi:hypothetical protein
LKSYGELNKTRLNASENALNLKVFWNGAVDAIAQGGPNIWRNIESHLSKSISKKGEGKQTESPNNIERNIIERDISGGQSRRFWAILASILTTILASILEFFFSSTSCENRSESAYN